MTHENPYAAPQTLEPQLDMAALPLAEFQAPRGKRRLFPERSTTELLRLVEKSKPLEIMLLVWLLLWFTAIPVFAVLRYHSQQNIDRLIWSMVTLTTARLLCSFLRSKLGRWYMLLCDAALICFCLAVILTAFPESVMFGNFGVYCLEALIALTIAVLAFRSCRVLLQARELFQPVCLQHDDLVRELAYRKEQQIE